MTITLRKFFDNLDCIDRVLSGESVIWRPETPEEEHLLGFFRPKTHRIEDEIIHTFYRFSSLEKVIYGRVIWGCASKVDTGNSLSNFIPEARLDEEIPGRLNFYHLALFQALSSFESASCDWADSVVAYKQESPGVFTRYDNHEYVHQLICDSLEELFEHSTQQLYTVRGLSFRQLLELDRIEKIYFSDLEIFTYQIIRESIDEPIPMKTVERILRLKDKGSFMAGNDVPKQRPLATKAENNYKRSLRALAQAIAGTIPDPVNKKYVSSLKQASIEAGLDPEDFPHDEQTKFQTWINQLTEPD